MSHQHLIGCLLIDDGLNYESAVSRVAELRAGTGSLESSFFVDDQDHGAALETLESQHVAVEHLAPARACRAWPIF